MLIHSATITGSVQLNNTDVSGITNVAGFATTSSVDGILVKTGSYASTGSNQFNGNQSISGSITSNGTITAQTLVVQTITSSVEYSSGSNQFGSTTGNTHQFTGSVLVSGSTTTTSWIKTSNNVFTGGNDTGIFLTGVTNDYSWGMNRETAGLTFYASSSSTPKLTITSGSNVGIGTTNPSEKLEVAGGIQIADSSTGGALRSGGEIIARRTSSSGEIRVGSGATADYVALYSNGAEKMRVSGSNVGIGITNPSVPLHILRYAGSSGTLLLEGNDNVVGNPSITFKNNNGGATSYISMPASAGVNINGALYVTSGNNVGIGISNPTTSKLEVNGTATIYSTLNVNPNATYSTDGSALNIDSNSWAIVDANAKRQMQRVIGYAGDYQQHVILLHPIYNGSSLISFCKAYGTIHASRGATFSGRISDTYEIDTSTAYNSYNGTLKSNSIQGKLYTCTYGGVKYLALIPGYRTSAVMYHFDGYIADNTSGNYTLKLVNYRASNTGTVLNSEIYNSLVEYTENDTFINGLLYPKQGIRFNSGATTLNYYEEGTFTPSNTASNMSTVTPTWGRYVRIGNQVTVNCRWNVDPGGTGKKYLVFNLPFSFYDNSSIGYTGVVSNYDSGASAYSSNVGTSVRNSSGSTVAQYVEAVFTSTSNTNMHFSMTYFTF